MNEGDWTEKYELPREAERESRWHPDCHQQGCIKALHGGDHCPGGACAVKHTRPRIKPLPPREPTLTVRIPATDGYLLEAVAEQRAIISNEEMDAVRRLAVAVVRSRENKGRMGL
jgi:hypothetical protein